MVSAYLILVAAFGVASVARVASGARPDSQHLWHPAVEAHAPFSEKRADDSKQGPYLTNVSRIVFHVFAPEDGEYSAKLRGPLTNEPTQSDVDKVEINGRPKPDSSDNKHRLKILTSWHHTLRLRKGHNTVRFTFRTAASLSGLDVAGAVAGFPSFVTLEAEDARCGGSIIEGEYHVYYPTPGKYDLQSEASGRKACQLQKPGDFVEFTAPADFSAMSLRYSIPDSPKGGGLSTQLEFSIDGVRQPDLQLTSKYMWYYGAYPWTNIPSQGFTHYMYNEVRRYIGAQKQGTKITVTIPMQQKVKDLGLPSTKPHEVCTPQTVGCTRKFPLPNSSTRALEMASGIQSVELSESYIKESSDGSAVVPITVDLVDLHDAGSQLPQPDDSVSVLDHGADDTGVRDSTTAFEQAMGAAGSNGKVWIPPGTFKVTSILQFNSVSLYGAGPWLSTLFGTGERVGQGAIGLYAASGVVNFHDFAIIGAVAERCDPCQVEGVGGQPAAGSIVQNLWIQHTKCGIWFDGPGSDVLITSNVVRDTTADGMNMHNGWNGNEVSYNSIRNTGDDNLALWSGSSLPNQQITVKGNRNQLPILANSIAVYGGHDIQVVDNVVEDSIYAGGGLHVGNRFGAKAVSGSITLTDNHATRCGAWEHDWDDQLGAVWFYAQDSDMTALIRVTNTVVDQPQFEGISLKGSSVNNLVVDTMQITDPITFVLQVESGGQGNFTNVNVNGQAFSSIYDCTVAFKVLAGSSEGWLTMCQDDSTCPTGSQCRGPAGSTFCSHCGWAPGWRPSMGPDGKLPRSSGPDGKLLRNGSVQVPGKVFLI